MHLTEEGLELRDTVKAMLIALGDLRVMQFDVTGLRNHKEAFFEAFGIGYANKETVEVIERALADLLYTPKRQIPILRSVQEGEKLTIFPLAVRPTDVHTYYRGLANAEEIRERTQSFLSHLAIRPFVTYIPPSPLKVSK